MTLESYTVFDEHEKERALKAARTARSTSSSCRVPNTLSSSVLGDVELIASIGPADDIGVTSMSVANGAKRPTFTSFAARLCFLIGRRAVGVEVLEGGGEAESGSGSI